MSMNTNIIGFKPPDEKWKKMKAVYDACNSANTALPTEVDDFFNGEHPDSSGVEVRLDDTACCRGYSEEMRDGFEILLDKVPKDVKIIRFWNSY